MSDNYEADEMGIFPPPEKDHSIWCLLAFMVVAFAIFNVLVEIGGRQ